VCYSWWVLSSLAIIGRLSWIDRDALKKFILASQDDETGGIADRPGDIVCCRVQWCRRRGCASATPKSFDLLKIRAEFLKILGKIPENLGENGAQGLQKNKRRPFLFRPHHKNDR